MQDIYIGRIIRNWLGQPIKVLSEQGENLYLCENIVTKEIFTMSKQAIRMSM